MAETTLDLRSIPKPEAYETLRTQIESVLEGITDEVTAMATMSALIHHAFGFLWTGFYRVVDAGHLLRVGPYQGTVGCLEIAFEQGVCGTVAATGRPLVVADVRAFPGHIECDARARSEIVIPVLDAGGTLRAVLDVDADVPGRFDEQDREGLTTLVKWFAIPRPDADGAVA